MLTMNLWTNVGLCNGASGIVVEFICAINQQPLTCLLLLLSCLMTIQANQFVAT